MHKVNVYVRNAQILRVIYKTMTIGPVGLDVGFNDRVVVNPSDSVSSPNRPASVGMSTVFSTSVSVARCLNVAGVVKLTSLVFVGLFVFCQ